MTREEKDLLIKDLCARLPYGVKVCSPDKTICSIWNVPTISVVTVINGSGQSSHPIKDIKPYLRPMSSMTEEEYKELCNSCKWLWFENDLRTVTHGDYKCYDWLDKNMFDYRGLIPMGLALEAPANMYKIK